MIGCQFVILLLKYYLTYICLLNSNEKIHEEMIHAIVRSPNSFFDNTPIGTIISKFSNDLGILDTSLAMPFIDVLEYSIMILVSFVNICQIEIYFIPPLIIAIIVAVYFFKYSKVVIAQCK